MRVLLTGASGFIGRECLATLATRGAEIHAVCRTPPKVTSPRTVAHAVNLFDHSRIDGLLSEVRPTHLLHVAWVTRPGDYWTSPLNLQWLAASAELLRLFAVHGGQRAVITGTCAEYDWSRAGVCDEETTPVMARSLYGVCKDSLRRTAEAFAATVGMSVGWARIFFPYGPGESPRRLIASVTRALLSGERARCTAGTQIRDFVHVRDVASALATLLDSKVTGPVNIGTGIPITLAEVVRRIGAAVGRPELIDLGALPTSETEPRVLVAGTRRLFGELGWRPAVGLDDGIADCVAWWRDAAGRGV